MATEATVRHLNRKQTLHVDLAQIDGAESHTLALDPARKAYVHLVRGQLNVNDTPLAAGDAALIESERTITLSAGHDAEVLVFDLSA